MTPEEINSLMDEVKDELKAKGVKFKKTKFVRKPGPWRKQ